MSATPRPGQATPRLAVDWVYIRTRTVVGLVVLLLVAGGVGAWWWLGGSVPAEEQASRALAVAETAIDEAAGKWGASQQLLRAEKHLSLGREAFDEQRFGSAIDEARAAEILAREVSAAGAGGEQTGVRIARVDGDVRVKRSGQFMWEEASERSMLAMGDQIRTGARASAQLLFFDGTMMTVQPGTLLEIRELFRDNRQRVQRVSERLAWGSLQASTNETEGVDSIHEVSTASAAVRTGETAEFRVAHDRERGESEFVALSGDLTLQAGEQEIPLPERTRVSTSGGRVLESAEILGPPLLKDPPDSRTFLSPNNTRIELSWLQVRQARSYHLQVSTNPVFNRIEHEADALRQASAMLPALGPGKYYWRVAAVDETGYPGRWSETRKFRVLGEKFQDPDDTQPPALEVSEILVVGTNAIISGRSEPGALVWISGERVDVDDDGKFTWVIKLHHDGENQIRFQAQDAAGNETNRLGYAYVDVF